MKVLVTGAAGRLGRHTVTALSELGHEVRATDRVTRAGLPFRIEVVDLAAPHEAYRVVDGVEAVVHLGNNAGALEGDVHRAFTENVTTNINVFTAAADVGVRTIVFASSIQVVSGSRLASDEGVGSCLSYLPMDGDLPPRTGNPYALGKHLSEIMLQHFCRTRPINGISLRYPHLCEDRAAGEKYISRTGHDRPDRRTLLDECFTRCTFGDAARLVGAILGADLPGYRCYLPATADRMLPGMDIRELLATYYPGVPQRTPITSAEGLVDISRVTAETGWMPASSPGTGAGV